MDAGALYGGLADGVHVHAVAIRYDTVAWTSRFLEQWPPGSDAHVSYFGRICEGPAYTVGNALGDAEEPAMANAR
jgi:hypothetical protein